MREKVVAERKLLGHPWHAPPHFGTEPSVYLLSAACFDHRAILSTVARRDEWLARLLTIRDESDVDLRAWVVLPNHYHLLARVALPSFEAWIHKRHNATATKWNREDGTPGRKVWHRFTDRAIRTEAHYFASLNYIHANPAKHGCVAKSQDWKWSSLHEYVESLGSERLADLWRTYPSDVKQAAAKAGITNLFYADAHTRSYFFGIFSQRTLIFYGD